jgi:hypothetical protein
MLVVGRSGQAMMSAPLQRFVDDLRYGGDTDREASAVVPVKFGGLIAVNRVLRGRRLLCGCHVDATPVIALDVRLRLVTCVDPGLRSV